MTLHDGKELDDDLRRRADKDLALATALGVDDVILRTQSAHPTSTKPNKTHQAVVKDGYANHGG